MGSPADIVMRGHELDYRYKQASKQRLQQTLSSLFGPIHEGMSFMGETGVKVDFREDEQKHAVQMLEMKIQAEKELEKLRQMGAMKMLSAKLGFQGQEAHLDRMMQQKKLDIEKMAVSSMVGSRAVRDKIAMETLKRTSPEAQHEFWKKQFDYEEQAAIRAEQRAAGRDMVNARFKTLFRGNDPKALVDLEAAKARLEATKLDTEIKRAKWARERSGWDAPKEREFLKAGVIGHIYRYGPQSLTEAMDLEMIRMLEAINPDLVDDWERLLKRVKSDQDAERAARETKAWIQSVFG